MAPLFGLVQLSLLALIATTLVSSAVSGGLYAALRARLLRLSPAARATRLVVLSASPALLGGGLTALCFLPSLATVIFGIGVDHCIEHPDHHGHLCLRHLPHDAGSVLVWSLLGAAMLAAVSVLLHRAHALFSAHRALNSLHTLPERGTHAVEWISSSTPLAFTVGIFRPRVLVSAALRDQLEPTLLAAVLEHEEAHRRRRDVFWKAVASLLASLHWPSVRKRLLEDLSVACEQAADAEAAEKAESLIVAKAILAVERLTASSQPFALPAGAAFGGPCVSARVEALLHRETGRSLRLGRWIAGVSILALALSAQIHHAVETLLTPLVQ